jgi:hypothetical protein
VQFVCFAGATSSDGTTAEADCRPSSSARVSGISFSSHDHLLVFYKLVLLNPNCASAESYLGSSPNKGCPTDNKGTILDATGSAFPDLYMEGSS